MNTTVKNNVVIKPANYACGMWYEVKVNGVVVACCGTMHEAQRKAKIFQENN